MVLELGELELRMGSVILESLFTAPQNWKYQNSEYGTVKFECTDFLSERQTLNVYFAEDNGENFRIIIPTHSYEFTNKELITELRNGFLELRKLRIEERKNEAQTKLINSLTEFFIKK